ncbi:MAG: DUF1579 family protein [Anaerolineaceae bacterium]|nr:DUF1579 family protein [Anaerolineaceae bacterium]
MKDSSGTVPAARLLDEFVGAWRNRGIVYPGRFGPGGDVSGETRFHWQMQGRWLCFDSRLQMPGMGEYQVQGGVTLDDDGGYRSWAANNLGNLLVYEGRHEGGQSLIFDQVHPPGAQRARVVYTLADDGRLLMRSENSADGSAWSVYFETVMERA